MYVYVHTYVQSLQENALKDENFMQIAASFVACGDIPVSFTGEEEDGLKQVRPHTLDTTTSFVVSFLLLKIVFDCWSL